MQRNRSVTELRQICKDQSPPLVTSKLKKWQIFERLRSRLFPAPSQNNLPCAGSTSGEPVNIEIATIKKAAKDVSTALSTMTSLAEENKKVLKSVQAEAKSAKSFAAKAASAAERAAEVEASKGMPGSAARLQAAVNPDDDASVSVSNMLFQQARRQAVEQRRRDKDNEKSIRDVLQYSKDVLMIGKHILLSLSWN